MPFSDERVADNGRDTADLVDIVAPIVYEQVTEPVTSSEVGGSLPDGGQRKATDERLADRFGVDEFEMTQQAIRVVLDELSHRGYLTKQLVPATETPTGFQVCYDRTDDEDGVLDELRDTASATLSSAEDSSDTDGTSKADTEPTSTEADSPAVDVSAATLTSGSLLKDRYRLETNLGGKSHTTVWKATDIDTDETVVIKIGTGDSAALITNEGFHLEYLHTEGLGGAIPNRREIFDIRDGTVLVKEYLDGMTLTELVEADDGLNDEETIYILKELTDIVASCHQEDLIVQNLLPEDVVLRPDGTVSLIDFDVAIDLRGDGPIRHPQTAYTPPEVGAKRDEMEDLIGGPSDVYQLGLVGVFMRIGFLPEDRPEQGLSPADYGRESKIGNVLEQATKQTVADRFNSAAVFHRRIQTHSE